MTIDVDSRRRMVVNKFSNRPPFDLKNREIPITKNVETRKKSFENVNKSYKSIIQQLDGELQETRTCPDNNKTNNIIPRIIESFKRVTPTRQVVFLKNRNNNLSSKDSSLQTLYRNNQNFGKHIPRHKIMKNLLQDFETGTVIENKNSSCDTIPTKDTSCDYLSKSEGYSFNTKVDKTTSTSGLPWPVVLQNGDRIPIRINKSHKSIVKSRSRIPQRKDARKKIELSKGDIGNEGSKPSVSSSGVEYAPIKDIPECLHEKQTDSKQMNRHLCVRENTYVLNEIRDEQKTVRNKERSFVQDQVEMFNNLTSTPGPRRKKLTRDRESEIMNSNMNKNYLGMMTSVKKHFPKLKPEPTSTDNCDWSNPEEDTTEVKFPKETRNAMEILIQNSRKHMRAPLTKYLKYQDGGLQPAIPEHAMDSNKNALPCFKNMLCDRVQHGGPCVNLQKNYTVQAQEKKE
nr:uncharacterized protein LOC111505106 [Leptinotarsa decemlineata]